MRYQNLLFVLFGIVASGTLWAQVEGANNTPSNNFYELGKVAFEEDDYINAIKFLFAYKMRHEEELEDNPEFLAKIDSALDQSEKALREALQYRDIRQRLKAQVPYFEPGYVAVEPDNAPRISQIGDEDLKARQQLLEKQIELMTLELELEKLRLETVKYQENKVIPDPDS